MSKKNKKALSTTQRRNELKRRIEAENFNADDYKFLSRAARELLEKKMRG